MADKPGLFFAQFDQLRTDLLSKFNFMANFKRSATGSFNSIINSSI